jgi:poly-gamma-glutamate synthesis protein (capsule biosynthesis protein)
MNGIKALNPSLISLANNHIFDHGEYGLKYTLNILKENNIPFVGAGESIKDASKPHIFEIKGHKIGIYSCAEHEFSTASNKMPGANPFDALESLDHINELSDKCDYVIVLYHGGKEHYRFPSPYLQRVCRKMIQKGADVVVCQHSHCIGCYEEYEGSFIVYGQGNFIFDRSQGDCWETSLLIKIEFDDTININFIPIVKKDNTIRLADEKESEKILSDFNNRSYEILEGEFIENNYRKYSKENIDSYLRKLSGFGKWASRVDRKILKGFLVKSKYNKTKLLAIKNYIECEAHRELILTGLSEEYKSGEKHS